jgi:neutral ceramidase
MGVKGLLAVTAMASLVACGDDNPSTPDGGVTTAHCEYEPLPPTAGAGGTVTAGALMAGAAERMPDIPVGTALGGYTSRAAFLGDAPEIDTRDVKISGSFNASIGIELAPRVKAVALSAGGETVVLLKMDSIFVYEGMLFDLETRLGPEFHGKLLLAASHSHSAWAQFTGHAPLKLGSGELRDVVYTRFLDALEGVARDALAARQPARLGVFTTTNFDPTDQINRDRRGENNMIPNGERDDDVMALLRVDTTAGAPIAIVPIFGGHPILNDDDNPFATADAVGGLERALGEQFDSKVVVMQLQSAGGDTSAVGHGHLDCNNHPGKTSDPCFSWTAEEGHGRAAVPELMAAWTSAGTTMRDSIELEMITRSVETGPHPESFTIRNGAMSYAPFDIERLPDGEVGDSSTGGMINSPVDEFNAPVGAALCETPTPMFPAAAIPGTEGILPYGSCLRLDVAGEILGPIFDIDFSVTETEPVCETTRTTISALRIGQFMIGTMPGELTTLLKRHIIDTSPDPANTIIVGYAQGHVGYLLRPEDWVLGGYEPSVTFWGPLEAEKIGEKLVELMPLAMTPMREDGATDSASKVATRRMTDNLDKDEPAMMRGTVPATIPDQIWARTGKPAQAQPTPTVSRVSGIAQFVWIGDDPLSKTPRVTLQKKDGANFVDVTRRSGRTVEDGEIVLAYTPTPLQRSGPQTHYWVAEWQAVPWIGAPAVDGLDARGGVPIGTYRFHVEGMGWTLDSNEFDVVEGGVVLSQPMRTNGNVRVTVAWSAPKGWRMMDATLMSNQPVAIREQPVTVELLNAGGSVIGSGVDVTTNVAGNATVPDQAGSIMARVRDRFGNTATIALP